MAKYLPIYHCLACGGVFRGIKTIKDSKMPIEIPDDKVEGICTGAANPLFKSPNMRKQIPYVIAHNCFENKTQIGVAIFAGFNQVRETEGAE